EPGGNGPPAGAALPGVCRPGQHGGAGAAVSPGGEGRQRAVRLDPGTADGLVLLPLLPEEIPGFVLCSKT
ncbi:unnamed protein product, partial [Tetraodon nigroviridis]